MKMRKFLLLILCVACTPLAFAGDHFEKTSSLGQLKLSETPMRGAHCDGSDKTDLSSESAVQPVPNKSSPATATSGRS